jgi:hypothetical protein
MLQDGRALTLPQKAFADAGPHSTTEPPNAPRLSHKTQMAKVAGEIGLCLNPCVEDGARKCSAALKGVNDAWKRRGGEVERAGHEWLSDSL